MQNVNLNFGYYQTLSSKVRKRNYLLINNNKKRLKKTENMFRVSQVIETQAEVLENKKCCGDSSRLVSSAAVFWDVTQCSPQRNGCSQPNHIPLPLLPNHSFGFIFKNQFAPNLSFETYRAQSENVFYLCIPSSETSQINMRISGLCLRTPKNTEDA